MSCVNPPLGWKAKCVECTVKMRVQVSMFAITSLQVFQGPTEINMFTYTGWSWEGRKALLSHCILRGYRLEYVKCTPHSLLLTLQESRLFPCSLPSAHIWLHCPTLTLQEMAFTPSFCKKKKYDGSKSQSFWCSSWLKEA